MSSDNKVKWLQYLFVNWFWSAIERTRKTVNECTVHLTSVACTQTRSIDLIDLIRSSRHNRCRVATTADTVTILSIEPNALKCKSHPTETLEVYPVAPVGISCNSNVQRNKLLLNVNEWVNRIHIQRNSQITQIYLSSDRITLKDLTKVNM